MSAQVSAGDRLTFTLFLALVAHAVILLGVTFDVGQLTRNQPTLEVTLARFNDPDAQQEADFLADQSQQGSGTEEQAQQLKTTEDSAFQDNQIQQISEPLPQVSLMPQTTEQRVVTSNSSWRKARNQQDITQQDTPEQTPQPNLETTDNIATLKALLADKQQRYAKRPRVRTLTAVSTRKAVDAAYVYQWLQKVERVGNLNYPKAARQQRMQGQVRLLVSLLPDGTVKQIQVLSSSGHTLLDDAAKRIVRLASPFAPFPHEIRQTTDELEIIRTWRFRTKEGFDAS